MHVELAQQFSESDFGQEASSILGKCVHCGFCTATCPTYQILGDELDGPRGRIYLIKEFLETGDCTDTTRTHLDRCLTCRACETTCPSGVNYGRLLEISRPQIDQTVPRGRRDRFKRWLLRRLISSRWFSMIFKIGQSLSVVMPSVVARHIPKSRAAGDRPTTRASKKVLMLEGCVQPAMAPVINAAASRVLMQIGYEVVSTPTAGCCGAIDLHLGAEAEAKDAIRRNIDAWWPHVQTGDIEAIVMTASGCGVTVRDYHEILKDDAIYREKARRVSELTRDLCEVIDPDRIDLNGALKGVRIAFHSPCTLQHGQKIIGKVESILSACGADLVVTKEKHLCCGAGGTYSLLQPELSGKLRRRKVESLTGDLPDFIATANIGCLTHLSSDSPTPVRHWIELIDPLNLEN